MARIPPLCVVIRYGYGGTAGNQPEFSVEVRIFTLVGFIIDGVFNGHLVYFHLGAMHWDSADTPLSGTRDPTGGLCGYPSVGPTGMGTLRLSLLGTLWLSLCHPLLSCP